MLFLVYDTQRQVGYPDYDCRKFHQVLSWGVMLWKSYRSCIVMVCKSICDEVLLFFSLFTYSLLSICCTDALLYDT